MSRPRRSSTVKRLLICFEWHALTVRSRRSPPKTDVHDIRIQDAAGWRSQGATASDCLAGTVAESPEIEKGTARAAESPFHPDCDSWRLDNSRSEEHAGAVPAGAGDQADLL